MEKYSILQASGERLLYNYGASNAATFGTLKKFKIQNQTRAKCRLSYLIDVCPTNMIWSS